MKSARLGPGLTPSSMVLALFAALVCSAGSWTFHAGSALAPEPADLKSSLAGSYGATAAAVIYEQKSAPLLLWPAAWQVGSAAAGTPCSPYGLPAGARLTNRIQARGSLRACLPVDTSTEPPANAVRPLPPMPVANCPGAGAGEAYSQVATTIVDVISWPADWKSNSKPNGPYPGQPCSDFPLQAGETTYKHIQSQVSSGSTEGPFRCVRIKDPTIYPGP
jgi:hypothetical protein